MYMLCRFSVIIIIITAYIIPNTPRGNYYSAPANRTKKKIIFQYIRISAYICASSACTAMSKHDLNNIHTPVK